MKVGINTLLWTGSFASSDLYLLPKVKELGFDAIEVARFDFSDFGLAPVVGRAAASLNLDLIVCSALTGRMSLVEPGSAAAAFAFLQNGVRWTAEAGADTFVGPFCSPVGYLTGRRRTEDEWNRAVERLQALTPLLDDGSDAGDRTAEPVRDLLSEYGRRRVRAL